MKFLHSIADTCKLDRGKLDQTTKKNEKKMKNKGTGEVGTNSV